MNTNDNKPMKKKDNKYQMDIKYNDILNNNFENEVIKSHICTIVENDYNNYEDDFDNENSDNSNSGSNSSYGERPYFNEDAYLHKYKNDFDHKSEQEFYDNEPFYYEKPFNNEEYKYNMEDDNKLINGYNGIINSRAKELVKKLESQKLFNEILEIIGRGKESISFIVTDLNNDYFVLKVFDGNYIKNPKIDELAMKEYRNLSKIYQSDLIPCPKPILHKELIVLMTLIGQPDNRALTLKEINIIDENFWLDMYRQVIKITRVLYQDCRLIHCKLNENNLLLLNNIVYLIDVSKCIDDLAIDSENKLFKDCNNINLFFRTKGIKTLLLKEYFSFVTDPKYGSCKDENFDFILNEFLLNTKYPKGIEKESYYLKMGSSHFSDDYDSEREEINVDLISNSKKRPLKNYIDSKKKLILPIDEKFQKSNEPISIRKKKILKKKNIRSKFNKRAKSKDTVSNDFTETKKSKKNQKIKPFKRSVSSNIESDNSSETEEKILKKRKTNSKCISRKSKKLQTKSKINKIYKEKKSIKNKKESKIKNKGNRLEVNLETEEDLNKTTKEKKMRKRKSKSNDIIKKKICKKEMEDKSKFNVESKEDLSVSNEEKKMRKRKSKHDDIEEKKVDQKEIEDKSEINVEFEEDLNESNKEKKIRKQKSKQDDIDEKKVDKKEIEGNSEVNIDCNEDISETNLEKKIRKHKNKYDENNEKKIEDKSEVNVESQEDLSDTNKNKISKHKNKYNDIEKNKISKKESENKSEVNVESKENISEINKENKIRKHKNKYDEFEETNVDQKEIEDND